ncbi:OadG family transporter subunit [Treponema sp.]|uniref:OadG family transporter subunit n=1 Tax=Treponema sp. TaxID=166 RepID=UPI003EFC7806
MTVLEMFSQSGVLTLLGMAIVFGFLIVLILAMMALHAFVHALKWDTVPAAPEAAVPASSAPAEDKGAVVAAIAAVLKEKNAL